MVFCRCGTAAGLRCVAGLNVSRGGFRKPGICIYPRLVKPEYIMEQFGEGMVWSRWGVIRY